MNKEYQKVPSFTPDTHKGCKGHADYMLDCEYTEKADRDLLVNVLSNYIDEA